MVALALGALGQASRRWRIAAVFAGFEFTVPLVGLLLGQGLAGELAGGGRWIGAALLAAVGVLTMREGRLANEQLAGRVAGTAGLVGLAAGLSLDNLLVGFGLGFGDVSPLLVATTIAVFSAVFTLVGLELGAAGRRHWERPAQIAAGTALVAVAVAVGAGWIA